MLTYGVIGGFGLGLIYLPAVVAVGYYFESKRALATGISVSINKLTMINNFFLQYNFRCADPVLELSSLHLWLLNCCMLTDGKVQI